jgi:myosin I
VVPTYSKPGTTATTRPTQPQGYGQRQGYGQVQASRASLSQASRAQPPPPPPPPPVQPPAPVQPTQPIYRAIYDFQGQTGSEMSFSKDEVLEITKKEGNGMPFSDGSNTRMVACET